MLLGTKRLPVSRLCASGGPKPCSGELSSHVPPRPPPPHLSPACAPHFLLTSCDPLGSGSTLRPYPTWTPVLIVELGDSSRIDTALLKNKDASRQDQRVSDHVSVLIGHFSCAAVAQSAKLVGASKAQCSGRCPLPHRCRELDRRFPGRLLEEA